MVFGTAKSARRRKRETLRRMYGNPWDSPKSSPRSRSVRKRSRSASKSTTSTPHAAWRSVSSRKLAFQ